MAIIEVTENKKQYLDLLLLADEQEDMIDRYLDKGRMYVLDDNGVKRCGKQRLINDNYASADYIDFPKRPSKEIDYMNDEDAKKFYAVSSADWSGRTSISKRPPSPLSDRSRRWRVSAS